MYSEENRTIFVSLVLTDFRECFHNCNKMNKIVVGSGLKTIGEGAFLYCDRLANVYFRGNAKQWNNIKFGDDNDRFVYCIDKRYSYTGE